MGGVFALATVVGRKAKCGNKNCDSPQPERLAGELKSGEAVDCAVAEMNGA